MVADLDDLADEATGPTTGMSSWTPSLRPDVDVDGGGEVAGAEVGDLGRNRLEVGQEGQVQEGRQLRRAPGPGRRPPRPPSSSWSISAWSFWFCSRTAP